MVRYYEGAYHITAKKRPSTDSNEMSKVKMGAAKKTGTLFWRIRTLKWKAPISLATSPFRPIRSTLHHQAAGLSPPHAIARLVPWDESDRHPLLMKFNSQAARRDTRRNGQISSTKSLATFPFRKAGRPVSPASTDEDLWQELVRVDILHSRNYRELLELDHHVPGLLHLLRVHVPKAVLRDSFVHEVV